jgi:DNA modification methylase
MSEKDYWDWMTRICELIYKKTVKGGAIYFMQREKNAGSVIRTLVDSGWTFQNLIIWRKRSAAVPSSMRYAKHYQIIAYATKEAKPRVFNKLRIDPPYASRVHPGQPVFEYKAGYRRKHGMALTDVWDDLRELTSGFFSGEEPLRHIVSQIFPKCKKCNKENFTIHVRERAHKQQSPIALLTRIILSSTKIGDLVFDPFAGTGTTSIVARQLKRQSVSVELDSKNIELIHKRIKLDRAIDDIEKLRDTYHLFTTKQHGSNVDLEEIWEKKPLKNIKVKNKN